MDYTEVPSKRSYELQDRPEAYTPYNRNSKKVVIDNSTVLLNITDHS